LRQSTDQAIQLLALQFQATRCGEDDVLAGNDDPNLPLVTCSTDHNTVYLLDKSIMSGEEIKTAGSGLDQQRGDYVVDVEFKSGGSKIWADFTAANVGTQTAFTLDSQVVSAPEIQEAIPGGRTQITGQFTDASARELANVLKYGSLPLSFDSSEAETVSATLGLASLEARPDRRCGGPGAGAALCAAVLPGARRADRAVPGAGRCHGLRAAGAARPVINYTLDLAGIAGLIIGIGTTADSFVVFFERIKDEIREGRSYRSAVPRGWARARKTILSGNAVTFLAAAVLYILAVGQVKGFAFTLGLTTILDVLVVFLVTWPLVYLSTKSTMLSKPHSTGSGRSSRSPASGAPRTRRDGDSQMAAKHSGTESTEAVELTGSAPQHGFFVRLYTGTGAFEVIGKRKFWYLVSGVIVAISVLAMLLRGFTFGIDFEGGTKVAMPVEGANGAATTEQVETVYSVTFGAPPESVVIVGNGPSAPCSCAPRRCPTRTPRSCAPHCSTPSNRRGPTASQQAGHQRLGGVVHLGWADHPEGADRAGGVPAAGVHLHHRALRAVHGHRGAGSDVLRPDRHRGRLRPGRFRGHPGHRDRPAHHPGLLDL
jgi:preprotein translocase subunit SecD